MINGLIMVVLQAGSLEVYKISNRPGFFWRNKDYPMGRGSFMTKEDAMADYYVKTGENVANAVTKGIMGVPATMPDFVEPKPSVIFVDFVAKKRIS